MKWPVVILFAAGIAGGGIWYWKDQGHDTRQFLTAAVVRGDLTQMVTATGQLNPVVNVQVGSQISGNIEKLFVDFNSPVKEGQVVAQIEPSIYQAAVTQAEGDLANARAALDLARIVAARTQALRAKNATPQSTLDKAVADLNQAVAAVRIKEGALEKAKLDLAHCTIYAPIDGIVISRNVDVGQTVAASLSAPVLFLIANDLAKMQIDANVAEADIGSVEIGQTVDFTVDAFPNRTFHGTVQQVRNAPITVQNVVTYDTVITVNNSDLKLKPGMTANVAIVVAQRRAALQIINSALRVRLAEVPSDRGEKSPPQAAGPSAGGLRAGLGKRERQIERTVYVLAPGNNPQPRQIKIGIGDGIYTEVLEGLKEGDLVVTGVSSQPASSGVNNPFGGGRRF